ncbi:uncharacterized protein J7T54_004576 [Emericellopsis cladophorae]|uniref:Uncharacterized protein n=1 Tax=Emericellopsis cladophorae TaxID=2686198 RepID=A0A9P9Y639_9HYPO|nr:uncharacterized protein J7T54_004576 [Emericellopsis cladophorae]KAI6784030.1 hypothetical protein J7T54_004576 [Emericellopsis cladophorae]
MGDHDINEDHAQASDAPPRAGDGPRTAQAKGAVSRWTRRVHKIYIICFHRGFAAFLVLPLVLALVFVAQKNHFGADQCKARESGCGFVGNEDAYGLGIRLGVYLQWLSVFLVVYLLPSEERSLMTSLITFSSALMMAILVLTFGGTCTYTVEIIVLLWTAFMTQALASITHTAQEIDDAGIREVPVISGLKRATTFQLNLDSPQGMHGFQSGSTLVEMCILGYAAWFWVCLLRGAEMVFAATPCGTSLFFFARIQDRKGIVVISALMTAVSLATLLFRLAAWIFRTSVKRWFSKRTYDMLGAVLVSIVYLPITLIAGITYLVPDTWMLKMFPGSGGREQLMVFLCAFVAFIVSVAGIELLLVWNGISDVYGVGSTGQLIPLTMGLVSLMPILWKLLRRYMAGEPLVPEPASNGSGLLIRGTALPHQGSPVEMAARQSDREALQLP